MLVQWLTATITTAVVVLTAMPVAIQALVQHRVLDRPGTRSAHTHPIPRGAGMVTGSAIAVGLLLGSDPATTSLAAAALGATVLGGIEDLHGLPIRVRLAGQLTVGAGFVALTWRMGAPLSIPVAVAATIFIAAYVNAFNFMDGINGISAATATLVGLTYIGVGQLRALPILSLFGTVLAVAAICFSPFNVPTARVFLGDSGSYSFGAVIACASIFAWRSGVPPDMVIAPLSLYLADTGSVIAKRLVHRRSLARPHQDHTYQRVMVLRGSHLQSTVIAAACIAMTSALGLATLGAGAAHRGLLDLTIALVVTGYLALPTLLQRRLKQTR